MHVGTGYFLNSPPRDAARFRSIPEIFVGSLHRGVGTSGQAVPGVLNGTPFFVDTGNLTGISNVQTLGLEGLWVRGHFRYKRKRWRPLSISPALTRFCAVPTSRLVTYNWRA